MTQPLSHPLSPEEVERLARKRAGAKLGWYAHAALYVVLLLNSLPSPPPGGAQVERN